MIVTCKRKYEQFRIYINDVLHLQLRLLDLTGLQSWIHGESEYFIEYYFSTGNKITTVYGKKELWESVLKAIDDHITVIS